MQYYVIKPQYSHFNIKKVTNGYTWTFSLFYI